MAFKKEAAMGVMLALLAGCGNASPTQEATPTPAPDPDESAVEERPSRGQLRLADGTPVFYLNKVEFSRDARKINVFVNRQKLQQSEFKIERHRLQILKAMPTRKNVIEIIGEDADGGIIDQSFEFVNPTELQTPDDIAPDTPVTPPEPSATPSPLNLMAATLTDIDQTGAPLEFMSLDEHQYFGGKTRIAGTLTFTSAPGEELSSVTLEILQAGTLLGHGELSEQGRTRLPLPFDAEGRLIIDAPLDLFEIDSPVLDQPLMDIPLTLQIRANTLQGADAVWTLDHDLQLLTRYRGTNRYPLCEDISCRDPLEGGDDWVLPQYISLLEYFSARFSIGDISNLNGGYFIGHSSHRRGNDVDGNFAGYDKRDAEVASEILELLNDSQYGSQIRLVFVTFTPEFRDTIEGVTLSDSRKSTDVILDLAGHRKHFHLRLDGHRSTK